MKSFRELRVWQAAMDLVEKVYARTQEPALKLAPGT